MGTDEAMAAVDADVAHGRSEMAMSRLTALIDEQPDRLDLRERLAQIYRNEGQADQAGRWSYLSDNPDAAEISAFERAYPSAYQRMQSLRWRGPEGAGDERVARRLAAIRLAAEAEVGHPLTWDEQTSRPRSALMTIGRVLFGILEVFAGLMTILVGLAYALRAVLAVIDWWGG